jgi:hypothetical protein
MLCKHYKEALIDAAAKGSQPQGDLRAHLTVCIACRAAFEQEQSLFASIDAGLHTVVNVEIPDSLLPCVRTSITEQSAVTRGWTPSWFALAGAAAMAVAFIAVYASRRASVCQPPVTSATNTISPAPKVLPTRDQNLNAAPLAITNPVPTIRTAATRKPAPRDAMPEVLVPRDQETMLVSYAEQRSHRKHVPLVAANFDPTNLSLLQIAPIQIDQLDVKLMTEEQAQ